MVAPRPLEADLQRQTIGLEWRPRYTPPRLNGWLSAVASQEPREMATASALERPAWTWHARGTWNARDDRLPSAAWLGLLWLRLIAGFGVDIKRFLHEAPPAPAVIYVHAAVFTGWMFLLTAQVLLAGISPERSRFRRGPRLS